MFITLLDLIDLALYLDIGISLDLLNLVHIYVDIWSMINRKAMTVVGFPISKTFNVKSLK